MTRLKELGIIFVASIEPLAPGAIDKADMCDHHIEAKSKSSKEEEPLNNTFMANAQNVERKWYVVDADGMVLGRVASQVANILRGKHKPTYTPHVDTGDYVIVVNADKIRLTGKKLDQKIYYHHSGFPGGLKETKYRDLMSNKPDFALKHAIVGMLPKGPLGRQMATKLHIFKGAEHNHQAQQPELLVLEK